MASLCIWRSSSRSTLATRREKTTEHAASPSKSTASHPITTAIVTQIVTHPHEELAYGTVVPAPMGPQCRPCASWVSGVLRGWRRFAVGSCRFRALEVLSRWFSPQGCSWSHLLLSPGRYRMCGFASRPALTHTEVVVPEHRKKSTRVRTWRPSAARYSPGWSGVQGGDSYGMRP